MRFISPQAARGITTVDQHTGHLDEEVSNISEVVVPMRPIKLLF
jgi:hypothetical protein